MENVAAQWVGEDRRARKGEEGDQFVAGQGALLASLERMELGICVVDEGLNFTGFNSRFFDLLDMPHDLFGIGDSYEDFVRHIRARDHCCPSETEFLVKERARSFVPTIFDHEVTERTLPDGMTLEIQYNPMPEGGFFCLYSDITQRKEKERLVSQSEQRARAAERRLADAIESVEEAFALYDSEDRLVTCSSKYREHFPSVADDRVPGAFFEDHLRKDILQHHLFEIEGDEEAYLKRHLALHRNPRKPFEHQLRNGRWILVNERRTSDGGTVLATHRCDGHQNPEARPPDVRGALFESVPRQSYDHVGDVAPGRTASRCQRHVVPVDGIPAGRGHWQAGVRS